MSLEQDVRDAREGYVSEDIGDGLIRTEAIIIGIISFVVLLFTGVRLLYALIAAASFSVVIIILVANFHVIALIFGILFSLIWGVATFFGSAYLLIELFDYEDTASLVICVIAAIIVIIISFFKHKVFAGIRYHSVRKHIVDSLDNLQK